MNWEEIEEQAEREQRERNRDMAELHDRLFDLKREIAACAEGLERFGGDPLIVAAARSAVEPLADYVCGSRADLDRIRRRICRLLDGEVYP